MKFTKIIALALVCIMALSLVACGGDKKPPVDGTSAPAITNATTTPADTTTAAPADTTTSAPADTTTSAPDTAVTTPAPADDTTKAPETEPTPSDLVKVDFSELSDAEKAALLSVMPDKLPDGTSYEIMCRTMCFDNADEDYMIGGNSANSVSYVDVEGGAIYGKAIRFAAKSDTKDARGEIQISPFEDVITTGARGILFYVDFSHVEINADAAMCASVTINVNDIRSNKPDNASIGYYYENGTWVETHNVTTCRLQIPANFAGWMYVPATSFISTKDTITFDTSNGLFPDIFVTNMRCYTDGYIYSADSYIIYDEICFVS